MNKKVIIEDRCSDSKLILEEIFKEGQKKRKEKKMKRLEELDKSLDCNDNSSGGRPPDESYSHS